MAEFCADCYNKLEGTNEKEDEFLMSDSLYVCEGCGREKYVVIRRREWYDGWFRRRKKG